MLDGDLTHGHVHRPFVRTGFVNRPFFHRTAFVRPGFVHRPFFHRTAFARPVFVHRPFFRRRFPAGAFAAGLIGGAALGTLAATPVYATPVVADYGPECFVVRRRFVNVWGDIIIRRRLVCT